MIRLREATKEDARLLWEWANENKVRENAYDQEKIPWIEHIEWFENKLNSNKSYLFIAQDSAIPIGQIRFDLKDNSNKAVVDISVDKSMRGKGYGIALIENGTRHFLKLKPNAEVHAYVKKGNIVSKKAFEKAGYKLKDIKNIKGIKSYHLITKGLS